MGEFFDRLFNSDEADTVFGFVLIFGIGGFLYIMNWRILLYNNIPKLNPKRKFVSMVPPLGGLIIAIGILLIGGGWWALLGLTDPCVWVFAYSIIREFGGKRNKHSGKDVNNEDERQETNENGKHSD